jgi:hypothetical protein
MSRRSPDPLSPLRRERRVAAEDDVWALQDRTEFSSERSWTRDVDGHHLWLVAVRGTWDIAAEGRLQLASAQPPPRLAPEYYGDPSWSSLRHDPDVTRQKPRTDVLVLGTAYAPGRRATTSFEARLAVADIDKRLKIFGPYPRGGRPSPVETVPLRYESAFGGVDDRSDPGRMDLRNPVGIGRFDGQGPQLLPVGDTSLPGGLGPIPSHWAPRLELQGTYDVSWQESRAPLLPEDWSLDSVCCAPADQQTRRPLRGGELVTLENLSPDGRMQFRLPKVRLGVDTLIAGRREHHRLSLATVCIEPDIHRLTLVWTSELRVRPSEVDRLEKSRVWKKRWQ